jgi:hypothetical protein
MEIKVFMKKVILKIMAKLGFSRTNKLLYIDMEQDPIFTSISNTVHSFTMTTKESMKALYDAVNYISKNNITGDIVECGVWRGGSSMVSALTLLHNKDTNRNLYLYDTFEGMSKPSDIDVSILGESAQEHWRKKYKCFADFDDVNANIKSTKYPKNKIHLIKGMVENTIPKTLPDKIAILRLDTDWYESTYHELIHLYPKLVIGGILIIDDYGCWNGSKKAVDTYFEENNISVFLHRVDFAVRVIRKT